MKSTTHHQNIRGFARIVAVGRAAWKYSIRTVVMLVIMGMMQRSVVLCSSQLEQIRKYTRSLEFDYVSWTINALFLKAQQLALDVSMFVDQDRQIEVVKEYLDLINDINQTASSISRIYADPAITDPESAAQDLLQQQKDLLEKNRQLAPLVESILQNQISSVLADEGITFLGQPLPPLMYHVSSLPMALIISPRTEIRQDADISLLPELSLDTITSVEKSVEEDEDVSSLVVPIGGIGIYPTMVMQTSDLPWLIEVVSHEWVHNFLTLRPLGMSYGITPELRTMNETVASIGGNELSDAVLAKFYPEYLPPEPVAQETPAQDEKTAGEEQPSEEDNVEPVEPVFSFNHEMNITRVAVDKLLAEGKVETAEQYMELRRRFIWENGYQIRRLNQAYFAFYGAYADVPGGAAGVDPVGPAVRTLRAQSDSLAEFLNTISWMTTFEELQSFVTE